MWLEPKTDWKSNDYYNIEDWRRVRSNLEHLREALLNLGTPGPDLLETETGRGHEELPYVHLVNNMETNLSTLRTLLGVNFTEDVAPRTWYERLSALYTTNPSYRDWNRWELLLRRVYESIQYIETYIFSPISGTCYSSGNRINIRFSRGR